MNTKVLINTSYVFSEHSYLHIFNGVVHGKKIIWVILYGVSQLKKFSSVLEVSLPFTCGLQVTKMLLIKELNMTFVIS